jgi:hypothetical protein
MDDIERDRIERYLYPRQSRRGRALGSTRSMDRK